MGLVGGHCYMTNMDEGVLLFLIGTLSIQSLVDVGCGTGGMVTFARTLGIKASGIDGDVTVHPDVLHNFDDAPLIIEPTDLAWSVEFLEHIEEQYLDNVFSVFEKCKYVFCTHNERPGPWHFNCRPNAYWVDIFDRHGFRYDGWMTEKCKLHSTMIREFVFDTGNFFIRKDIVC